MNYKQESELYLKMYPDLMKWINECPLCHTKGYKPEMPEHIGSEYSFAGKNLRKLFNPLEVDDHGYCLQCSRYINEKHD